jgi:hypothetical protein
MTRDELTDSLLRPLRQRQLCVTAPLPFTTRNQERSQRQVEFGKKSDKQVREKLKSIIQILDAFVVEYEPFKGLVEAKGLEDKVLTPSPAALREAKQLALDILVEL